MPAKKLREFLDSQGIAYTTISHAAAYTAKEIAALTHISNKELAKTVVIGDRSVVGGYSLLTAGSELAADECTRAFLVSPPFSRWEHGRRTIFGRRRGR